MSLSLCTESSESSEVAADLDLGRASARWSSVVTLLLLLLRTSLCVSASHSHKHDARRASYRLQGRPLALVALARRRQPHPAPDLVVGVRGARRRPPQGLPRAGSAGGQLRAAAAGGAHERGRYVEHQLRGSVQGRRAHGRRCAVRQRLAQADPRFPPLWYLSRAAIRSVHGPEPRVRPVRRQAVGSLSSVRHAPVPLGQAAPRRRAPPAVQARHLPRGRRAPTPLVHLSPSRPRRTPFLLLQGRRPARHPARAIAPRPRRLLARLPRVRQPEPRAPWRAQVQARQVLERRACRVQLPTARRAGNGGRDVLRRHVRARGGRGRGAASRSQAGGRERGRDQGGGERGRRLGAGDVRSVR